MECLTEESLVRAFLNLIDAVSVPIYTMVVLGFCAGLILGWLTASDILRAMYRAAIRANRSRQEYENGRN